MTSVSLVIVDIEADQRSDGEVRQDQAIEIGAVRWVSGEGIVSEHRVLIRPTWGSLSPFIVQFCGYAPDEVAAIESADAFPRALASLLSWAETPPGGIFASWGDYDRKQLLRDCERHGMPPPAWLSRHLNLKALHAAFHRRKPCGMAAALERLGAPLTGRHHVGIDDARNIARIVADLHARGARFDPEG